jgi:ankyrin repeat protein
MKKANYTVGHSEVVLQLAKIHKANLDLKDGKGKTALARAAQEGTIAIATNLIKYGAGADLADNDAVTPLMLAAKAKSIDICKLLIEAGANPEAADKKGKDVLKYAGGLKKAGGDLWGVLEAAVAASGGGGGGGKKKKKK